MELTAADIMRESARLGIAPSLLLRSDALHGLIEQFAHREVEGKGNLDQG